jgi:hypothetical protein
MTELIAIYRNHEITIQCPLSRSYSDKRTNEVKGNTRVGSWLICIVSLNVQKKVRQ